MKKILWWLWKLLPLIIVIVRFIYRVIEAHRGILLGDNVDTMGQEIVDRIKKTYKELRTIDQHVPGGAKTLFVEVLELREKNLPEKDLIGVSALAVAYQKILTRLLAFETMLRMVDHQDPAILRKLVEEVRGIHERAKEIAVMAEALSRTEPPTLHPPPV